MRNKAKKKLQYYHTEETIIDKSHMNTFENKMYFDYFEQKITKYNLFWSCETPNTYNCVKMNFYFIEKV